MAFISRLALAGVSLLAISTPAFAQDAQTAVGDSTEANEDIVVTGTLIRGIAPVGNNVIGVGEQKIQASGASNTSELLAKLPQLGNFGAAPFGTSPQIGANSSNPINRPNLRNLPGANTSGSLTPPQSTALARHRGVPVYTIAAGRNGMVPFPIFDDYGRRVGTRMFPSSLDIDAMKTMAAETGGHFSQAGDVKSLDEAFKAIDRARKTEFRVRTRLTTTELFPWFLAPGLILMLLAAPVWGPIRWRLPKMART